MKVPLLTAREYKLLLNASKFKSAPTLDMANAFWTRNIAPILKARRIKPNGKSNTKGTGGAPKFDKLLRRKVLFWDTKNCVLNANSYSFRQREELDAEGRDKGDQEISLKLRTPDLFVAAGTELPGKRSDKKAKPVTKLEEDIAPLAVKAHNAGKKAQISLPQTRSMRSRFSVSTKQSLPPPVTFGELLKLYPTLADSLRSNQAKLPARSMRLSAGKKIEEFVFEGAEVDIGSGFKCEFAMTLWYFSRSAKSPGSAEISFKCKLRNGAIPLLQAQHALNIFIALQTDLGNLVELEGTSKTELVLPKCS